MTPLFRCFSILTALFLGIGCGPGVSQAAETPARQISVTGTGAAAAKPDIATVTAGVTSEAETAAQALSQNSAAMRAVLDALKQLGLADRDVQTSNFSIQPQYNRVDRRASSSDREPQIIGYTVTNTVVAVVRDLEKLGTVLDRIVSNGANTIGNLSFDIAEPGPVYDEARRNAVQDAKRKAGLFAEEAGVRLGRVLTINELQGGRPGRARATLAESSEVPIAAGENTISMSVTMTFELEDM